MQLSVIVTVLDSHEVVRRQLLHLGRILPPGCELILIDDGSEPPLRPVCDAVAKPFAFTLHATGDHRPWTQPRARNIGASLARAEKLLFFDIDHILTAAVLEACLGYDGDKLHWRRRPAILDERGQVVTDPAVLRDYGSGKDVADVHLNSFLIRRQVFEALGGYDERFCGRYGGDDVDFAARYEALCRDRLVHPAEVADAVGYVFPDPAADRRRLFHSLARTRTNVRDAGARRTHTSYGDMCCP
jgi:predicted glycosyltransferase involved in capsule biosynthesis